MEVRLGGMLIPGAPFVVKAYDVNKVKVTDVQNGVVGKPVYFCSKWRTLMTRSSPVRNKI